MEENPQAWQHGSCLFALMVLTVGEASSEPVMGLAASAAIQCDITVSSLVGQQCTHGNFSSDCFGFWGFHITDDEQRYSDVSVSIQLDCGVVSFPVVSQTHCEADVL